MKITLKLVQFYFYININAILKSKFKFIIIFKINLNAILKFKFNIKF